MLVVFDIQNSQRKFEIFILAYLNILQIQAYYFISSQNRISLLEDFPQHILILITHILAIYKGALAVWGRAVKILEKI